MVVHVKLFSRFRAHLPAVARGQASVELPEDATVQRLLNQLGILGRVKLVTINGERVTDRDHRLHDGDQVRVFPFAVGG